MQSSEDGDEVKVEGSATSIEEPTDRRLLGSAPTGQGAAASQPGSELTAVKLETRTSTPLPTSVIEALQSKVLPPTAMTRIALCCQQCSWQTAAIVGHAQLRQWPV